MDSHSNYDSQSDFPLPMEPQIAHQGSPDLGIQSDSDEGRLSENAQVENQFHGSNIAGLQSSPSMHFPADLNMPSMHQTIMRGWVNRLVGLIDKTSILVKTGILSLFLDQALKKEQNSEKKEESPPIDAQTASVIQKIELAFQKENLIRTLIHLNSQRQIEQARSRLTGVEFPPPNPPSHSMPEEAAQDDFFKKVPQVGRQQETDRRTSANSVQSLEEQIKLSLGGGVQNQASTNSQVQDHDVNNKNSAFHYSVVSHKGRQLQFLLSQIPDEDKTLIYAKAKRETPFTKNRSPHTSMLRGVFKRGGLYRCLFKKNGIIKKDLGYYKTDIEAARAYDYQEIRSSGIKVSSKLMHQANCNFSYTKRELAEVLKEKVWKILKLPQLKNSPPPRH